MGIFLAHINLVLGGQLAPPKNVFGDTLYSSHAMFAPSQLLGVLDVMTVSCVRRLNMGVQIQRSMAYPECSYARYASVSDRLSDPPTVHMRSPSVTNWASSQKDLSEMRQATRMTLFGQEVLGNREDAGWPGIRLVAKRTTSDPKCAEQPGKQ